jgi:hypothetical protein
MLAAALLIGACSASDDTATTSTPGSSATDAQPGATTTTGIPAATTATAPPATTTQTDAPTTTPTTAAAPPSTEVPSSTSAPTTVTGTTDADFTDAEANDRDDARTALITLSDFPDGWVEDPIDDDDDIGTEEFEAQFDACLDRDDDLRVGDELDRLKVGTGDFHPVDVDTTTVSHEVALAPDLETALAVMTEVRIDGAETCLAAVIGDFYRTAFADDPELADVDVGDVTVTRTEQDSDPDIAVGVLLEVPLTIGDQTVSQFLELLYQRQGRALSELSFASFGAPFSRDGYTVLSDEVSVRLATIGD